MNFDDMADRDQAITVPCPYCHATAGEPCVRRGTDEPLENVAAHFSRLDAAGVTHAPLDVREIREPNRWNP